MSAHITIRCLAVALAATAPAAAACAQGFTARVNLASNGAQANGASHEAELSRDALHVAFSSSASNLVAGDTNACDDVFLRHVASGVIVRVSVSSLGAEADGASRGPSLSHDGRFVAFTSDATNLVAGDTNALADVFVRDTQLGQTTRASVSGAGAQANGTSSRAWLSGDGLRVAFTSEASNLVAYDPNAFADVFVRDLASNSTALASIGLGGLPADGASEVDSISFDGRFVSVTSFATNLGVQVTDGSRNCFVMDTTNATGELVSRAYYGPAVGCEPGSSVSDDGRFVAFTSASDWVVVNDLASAADTYLRDMAAGTNQRISWAESGEQVLAPSSSPRISGDARYVAFVTDEAAAADDVNGSPDVYVRDRQLATTRLVSRAVHGESGDQGSAQPSLSADPRFVLFTSSSTDLVHGDTNSARDVFVRDSLTPSPAIYCTAKTNSLGCVPRVAFSGAPSATSAAPFLIGTTQSLNQRAGLLFFGFSVADAPFDGGKRCIGFPLLRTQLQSSGGSASPANDCSGAYSFDFNALIQSGGHFALVPGAWAYAQYWSRDSASPSTTNVTDALAFVIGS